MGLSFRSAGAAAALMLAGAAGASQTARAEPWVIAKAAAPYKGTDLHVIFLDRPGYRAIIKLLPEFEKQTGIKVDYEIVPYENTREKEVLNFNGQGDLSIALVALVWIGEYAENGWIQPIDKFSSDASMACRSTTTRACCSTTSACSRTRASIIRPRLGTS